MSQVMNSSEKKRRKGTCKRSPLLAGVHERRLHSTSTNKVENLMKSPVSVSTVEYWGWWGCKLAMQVQYEQLLTTFVSFMRIASFYLINVEINFRRRLKFPFKSVGSFGPHKIPLFVLWKGKKMLSFHQGFRQTGERTLHDAYVIYATVEVFRLHDHYSRHQLSSVIIPHRSISTLP